MKKGLLFLFPFLLFACYTLDVKLEIDSPKELYFKKAQESAAYRDYRTAIKTYELFIDRYPDDTLNVYTARYELGYIKYKSRQYEEAKADLEALLSVPSGVPNWIPVLSQRTLDKIELKLHPPKKEKKVKEPKTPKIKKAKEVKEIEEEPVLFPEPSSEEDPIQESNTNEPEFGF